jgi:allophanate hydrolase subunit 2
VLGFGLRLNDGDEIDLVRQVRSVANPCLGVPFFRIPVQISRLPGQVVIDVVDGPDISEFGDTADRIFEAPYVVGVQSNHVGLRLGGPMPVRQTTAEVLSRGVPVGAVEAPAGDQLLVLHRGRGVTAGYPVLSVVTEPGLDLMAQLRPGDQMSFRRVSLARATQNARQRRAQIDRLQNAVGQAFEALGLFDNASGDPRWSATPTSNNR